MNKSIIIIGAGIGGMSAGVYGQKNGFDTQIFEAHTVPGGQACTWTRKGYSFDGCIHHLFGCAPTSKLYKMWQEIGAMPIQMEHPWDCVSATDKSGKTFHDYYDLDKLRAHMLELAPEDEATIDEYIKAIRNFGKKDLVGEFAVSGVMGAIRLTPFIISKMKYFSMTMAGFAKKFKNPLLQKAFPLLEYSFTDIPFAIHLIKKSVGAKGEIVWPKGGSIAMVKAIAKKYTDLGGKLHLGTKVAKILTKDGVAVGVKLEDGTEHFADYVISNADGRKTILDLLDGQFADAKIREYCTPPKEFVSAWSVHVFLGVKRDLSKEPSSMILLLDKPEEIAGRTVKHLDLQMFGFDKSMAPEGKGVIKVELFSDYKMWEELSHDRQKYEAEKDKVARKAIELLEVRYPGISADVEVIDVPTMMTWSRYMGGSYGFMITPNRKNNIIGSIMGLGNLETLPGLANFRFVGTWATSAGALFSNALSGKSAIHKICDGEGMRFII